MASLRILERSRVSPPTGAVAETALPLTAFDLIWLKGGTVERVFFYRLPHSTAYFCASVLPHLKSSLSLALQQFYPLAGKIRRSPELDDDKYEIRYVDGDSVSFTVAEYDADFDDVSGDHARGVGPLLPLLPQLPRSDDDSVSVLALQVTVFPNQGVAVGVAVHHAGCDGSSSMRFMFSWASTCAGPRSSAAVVATPPVFDRSLVSVPRDLYSIFHRYFGQRADWIIHEDPPVDMVIATFTLKGDRIRRLKELISAKAGAMEGGGASLRCSTIMATYAYVWVCLIKARAYGSDRTAHLLFAADCRGRLRPPLPAAYFGNCLGCCFVEVKAGELLRENGVVSAAKAVGKAIERFGDDPLRGAETWPERIKYIAPQQPLSVAGSPRFRVYDLDFGWGRPKKVEVTSIVRSGAMSLAESRDEDGGVEIGMGLLKHEMDEFATHFIDGLDRLQ
ncbi:phenolic glucoside malonyltransferase 1-like [Musa acuminata AAA Group]|uniref:phenolic glucoside malonyltransferase 1-like n=1 Tax=Musa acuminata AAA Group TaxID=214697 RepID=UPI0031E1DFBC